MQNTEEEFWVLSELITMQDRKTAMLAETLLWNANGVPDNNVMAQLTALITSSGTAIEFHEKLPALLAEIAAAQGKTERTIKSEDAYVCRMQGPDIHGYSL